MIDKRVQKNQEFVLGRWPVENLLQKKQT